MNKKKYQMKKSFYLELEILKQIEAIIETEQIALTTYINQLISKDIEIRKETH